MPGAFRCLILALMLSPGAPVRAFPDQAPAAHTGDFGEPDCSSCHFSDPRPAAGILGIAGLPGLLAGTAHYQAGRHYRLVLELTDREAKRAGFQLSLRHPQQSCEGCQAGELLPVAGMRKEVSDGITYLSHQLSATEPGSPWEFDWQAPEQGGSVVLSIAVNLADGDESALGDQVYLGSYLLESQ